MCLLFAPGLRARGFWLAAPFEEEGAGFAVIAAGQPAPATVQLHYPDGERQIRAAAGEVPASSSLRRAIFHLPAGLAQEFKVWAHRITTGGDSERLPGQLDVHTEEETRQFDLQLADEPIPLSVADTACQVDITLVESSETLD
jgi:hypothetical protein